MFPYWSDGRTAGVRPCCSSSKKKVTHGASPSTSWCTNYLDLGELYETDRVVPVVIFLRGQAPRRELVFGVVLNM